MSTKSKRHIHKYHKKFRVGSTLVWSCALPDCLHYMPKHMEDFVEGKNSYCWECNAQIVLDQVNMTEELPRCDDCRTGVTAEKINQMVPDISGFLKHLESK